MSAMCASHHSEDDEWWLINDESVSETSFECTVDEQRAWNGFRFVRGFWLT